MQMHLEYENFMESSLCVWLTHTFEALQPPASLYDFADGEFLNKIMCSIVPAKFTMSRVNKDVGEDAKCRIENLNHLLKNMINYYEEALNSHVICKLPDIRTIGTQPQAYVAGVELEKLFTLILGIAFQCDNNDTYVKAAYQLPEDVQNDLMTSYREVHDSTNLVMSNYIDTDALDKTEVDNVCHAVLSSLQNVVLERNEIHEKYIRVAAERDEYLAVQANSKGRRSTASMNDSLSDSRDSRCATPAQSAEIAELRAKILAYKDEIESKSDTINKLRSEAETSKEQITRLQQEYRTLYDEAQDARIYRDEIDILRLKAEKLDKYEADIFKYRNKLEDMEYLKNKVKELNDRNDQLVEMNELLKEELVNSEQTNKAFIAEEEKNVKLRGMLEELSAQKEYSQRVIQDLNNKRKQVEMELKHSTSMVSQMQAEIEKLTNSNDEIRMLLREQDGEGSSTNYMTIDKELSHDDNGETPIINRRRSTIKDGMKEDVNEVLAGKIKRLEMDNLHLKTQAEHLKNSNAKLQVLEQNTERDKLTITTNKSEIARLQNELTIEKGKLDCMTAKLEEARDVLEEIGYDPDKLSEAAPVSDREKFLKYEERLKQSLNQSLKLKEERINVLEDRVKENTTQNDSLRQELSVIKKQNKSIQKNNKSLQQSLDASIASIPATSPPRRISKGVQYEHHVSLTSTPIKDQRKSPGPVIGEISSIAANNENMSPNRSSSKILDVSYESVSLSEREIEMQLLRQDMFSLKEENDKIFLENENLEQQVGELQTERRSHLTEIQNLREEVINLRNEKDDQAREVERRSNKLEEYKMLLADKEDINDKLKRACEEIEREKNLANAQSQRVLLQSQELLMKTIETQERSKEEALVYKDQIMTMKQDYQALAQHLKTQSSESTKKKPFYKQMFKLKKGKSKEDGSQQPTPNIDEYISQLRQLNMDSGRLSPDELESNGFYPREHFVDSDSSSRTMSGDGRFERGSVNSLPDNPMSSRNAGQLSRTQSYVPDTEWRTLSSGDKSGTPKRQGSLRLKTKSESLDLTPRVEPRTMARPLPPGTHGTPDSRPASSHSHQDHRSLSSHSMHQDLHRQSSNHSSSNNFTGLQDHRQSSNHNALSSSSSLTGSLAHEASLQFEQPSAFRQYNTSLPKLPPRTHRPDTSHSDHRSDSGSDHARYQRGLRDEDTQSSSYYEYGCV